MVIYPFSNSWTYTIHAETLQYFVLKNRSERMFKSDLICYFYTEFHSFWDILITTQAQRIQTIVFFKKGFSQRSGKSGLWPNNKKPFRDTLNILILWCKLEQLPRYSKFHFVCKSHGNYACQRLLQSSILWGWRIEQTANLLPFCCIGIYLTSRQP